MPFPPPPIEAFSMTGKPISRHTRRASSASFSGSAVPGTTGTPAAIMRWRAAILSPMASIVSAVGPMKMMPAASQRRTNSAFSDKKP